MADASATEFNQKTEPERKVEDQTIDYFEVSDVSEEDSGIAEEETVIGALENQSARKTPRTPRSQKSDTLKDKKDQSEERQRTPSFEDKIDAELLKTMAEIEDL